MPGQVHEGACHGATTHTQSGEGRFKLVRSKLATINALAWVGAVRLNYNHCARSDCTIAARILASLWGDDARGQRRLEWRNYLNTTSLLSLLAPPPPFNSTRLGNYYYYYYYYYHNYCRCYPAALLSVGSRSEDGISCKTN